MKQAFLLSEQGVVNIYFIRDQNPRIQWLIDLGIPNFSVFMLELPIPPDNPNHAEIVFHEGTALLLEKIKVFLAEQEFESDAGVIRSIIQAIRKTEIDYGSPEVFYGYEILFPLTKEFYTKVMNRIVLQKMGSVNMDISNSVWKGPQVGGRYKNPLEGRMVKQKDQRALDDARKIIQRYKQTIHKDTPGPMYVILYDRNGMPRGVQRVTNKGLTKWASPVWSSWWIIDGENVRVPDGYEHWEVAVERLPKMKDRFQATDKGLDKGWIRVSVMTPTLYFEVRQWNDKLLRQAQEFADSVGGIADVVVEQAVMDQNTKRYNMQSLSLPVEDFLGAANCVEMWRGGAGLPVRGK